jgi:23S rRNA (guanosine2251-2'-O)-methyltransferase
MAGEKELLYGLHAVGAALTHDPQSVLALWVQAGRRDERIERLLEAAAAAGVAVRQVARQELDRIAGGARHQGVIAQARSMPVRDEGDLDALLDGLTAPPFLLVLDGVQDPHNLGACLRTADAAGVHAVVVPKDRAVGLTATVRKVASGAAETVPFVQVTNLARCLRELRERGMWLVGASGEAETDLYAADLRGPLALVLGAEEKGLRRLTREHCDLLVRIPMDGTVESLNVSVATGILLFEAVRQRRAAK